MPTMTASNFWASPDPSYTIRPERIYNSHYGNGVPGNVYLLVLSSWKVNIAENPIAVMGL